ncbi:MAG TPA: NAD(P)H-dependent glycerol-3-phosphate dehydrogenase [Candidatus Binataceae bacterium]|nr:NAD(P)H-dependent glycerol-3-phosphate dehydrogenase [Candidatus Binataceae bacterium]
MSAIAVLGAGAWGTAIAVGLARAGHRVTLCARRAEHAAAMRARRENEAYLPGVPLPAALALSDRWVEAAGTAEVVVMAVPSGFARTAMTPVGAALGAHTTLVSVAKGIEDGSLKTMSAMLAEAAPAVSRVAVLSGPSFAAEVARSKPAAVVAAARDDAVARDVQELFASRSLRVYRSTDVVGVELAGAAKNVIAIAAGICDGLELGASARAALITRGLAEVGRLATSAGGRAETMAGLAGLGDLVLTCTGELSRNRALGLRIGRGEPAGASTESEHGAAGGRPVAEGMSNARAIRRLAQRMGVEMPIVAAVCRVLYEGAAANAMVEELLSRELKAEF